MQTLTLPTKVVHSAAVDYLIAREEKIEVEKAELIAQFINLPIPWIRRLLGKKTRSQQEAIDLLNRERLVDPNLSGAHGWATAQRALRLKERAYQALMAGYATVALDADDAQLVDQYLRSLNNVETKLAVC